MIVKIAIQNNEERDIKDHLIFTSCCKDHLFSLLSIVEDFCHTFFSDEIKISAHLIDEEINDVDLEDVEHLNHDIMFNSILDTYPDYTNEISNIIEIPVTGEFLKISMNAKSMNVAINNEINDNSPYEHAESISVIIMTLHNKIIDVMRHNSYFPIFDLVKNTANGQIHTFSHNEENANSLSFNTHAYLSISRDSSALENSFYLNHITETAISRAEVSTPKLISELMISTQIITRSSIESMIEEGDFVDLGIMTDLEEAIYYEESDQGYTIAQVTKIAFLEQMMYLHAIEDDISPEQVNLIGNPEFNHENNMINMLNKLLINKFNLEENNICLDEILRIENSFEMFDNENQIKELESLDTTIAQVMTEVVQQAYFQECIYKGLDKGIFIEKENGYDLTPFHKPENDIEVPPSNKLH
jgi:hypothetical protein